MTLSVSIVASTSNIAFGNQPGWACGIESVYPIAQRLPVHRGNLRRFSAARVAGYSSF
jgi:hypothetical protein